METTAPTAGQVEGHYLRERNALVNRLRSSAIFRDYQRAFQSITGLPLALRAAGAYQQGLAGVKHGNDLCALLTAHNRTCAACLNAQQHLEAASLARPGTVVCFAGLNESAVPIKVGDGVVAYLQTGQVLFHAPSPAETGRVTRQVIALDARIRPEELEAAYLGTRIISGHQYRSALQLLEIFADQLSTLSNRIMLRESLTEPPAITRARSYIADHLTETLSLAQVSRAVGMSSFYFCKCFRRSTGLTFTSYLSRLRIEAVKQLLLNPYKRVSEAAYEVGFQSLSQFNRVFHRVTGLQPSVYRERLHVSSAGCDDRRPRRNHAA